MNPFIKTALWFLGIPGLGIVITLVGGTYHWEMGDNIFNAMWRHPSGWTVVGGIIFYIGFLINLAYILNAWRNMIKKDK